MASGPQFEELTLEKLETFMLRFADERRTGQLKIQGEGARGGRIDLHAGKIVNVDSPFASETLGEIARKLGFLSKFDVQKVVDALSSSENAGRQLAEILLEEKLLTTESLEACLRYQAEAALHSMIGFHGRISFLPGKVSSASISLDAREMLDRIRERDHVEEMGSAFLGMTGGDGDSGEAAPEFASQLEMRRIAQAAIRDAALAAEQMQADLDAQASQAAEELLEDAGLESAELVEDLEVPATGSGKPDGAEGAERPSLSRVVLDICRPGASSTDALLGYAIDCGRRAILFAATSKGLRVAGRKTRDGDSFAGDLEGLLLPEATEEGVVGATMKERVASHGPFELRDDADKALETALGPAPEGKKVMFPIALHDRAIGLLYLDGISEADAESLDDLAAAVAATAVVMENKLVTRTAGVRKK